MRTRFLNIDYFAPENLPFSRLPLPHFPSDSLSTFQDLLHFDSIPQISLGIDNLSIDSALSKFFHEVLPHRINDDNGDFVAGGGYSEERIFNSGIVETRLLEEEATVPDVDNEEESRKKFEFMKKNDGIDLSNRNLRHEMIHFETPQLDAFLENTFLFEKEEVENFNVFPAVEFILEDLNQGLLTYPSEVKESVYAVESITTEYLEDQKSCLLEDDFAQDQKLLHQTTFPFLEVDEMILETLACLSLDDEILLVLENTESPHRIENDNLLANGEEYLCWMKYDIEKFLSDHFLRPCPDFELASLDISRESNLMIMLETLEIPVNSPVLIKSSDDMPVGPSTFEEFQMLDIHLNQPFEAFFDSKTPTISEISDWMFSENMNFKNFNDLVVCHELAFEDDTFKSLPVPILSNQETFRSLYAFTEEILANQSRQSLFASDGIYLDWHLLEENSCDSRIYYSYQNMLEEIDLQPIKLDPEPCENGSILHGYIFSDDSLMREETEENGELKESFTNHISMFSSQTIEVASSNLLNDRCPQKRSQDLVPIVEDSEKALLSWKSISESNDLDFFLNPKKPAGVKMCQSVFSAIDTSSMVPKVSCIGPLNDQPSVSGDGVSPKKWHVVSNKVCLSNNILDLINNSEKTYLAILQNETELRKIYLPCVAEDHFRMLSLPKQKLIDCIRRIYLQGTNTYWEEKIMTLATLYAIKQIAWYLCFYGIHPAHLYLNKLCQSLECLKARLGFLLSLIEDARIMVDKEITISHPALTTIQEILCSKPATDTLKVLVVANQIFWWSLKKRFVSMGLSFEELNYESPTEQQISNTFIMVDDLHACNCLLVSQEKIPARFPFNKFSIILEYGGPNCSSQISSRLSKLVDLPQLHFVMLELDNSGNCKAFCEGVDIPQHKELTIEEKSLVKNKSVMLEKLLKFLPLEGKYDLASLEAAIEVEDCPVPLRVPVVPIVGKSQHVDQISFPEAIVIVNTQNFEKEMIVSRRSSYQRILALEKEGVQVVERDFHLPVDLIISSSTCLMWYDCTNIHRKASTSDEASSCLNLCIENMATEVLTSLSFTFSGCVLVFEGETNFLSTVMESSDGLYAAAASLEIDFQLFCSYSSEMTDEIILGCIGYVSKLTRGLLPKMPESETLAESFLTSFPSINPLTAHVILSSEGVLIEFLEWSHERRLHAINKYSIPDESISLFSALCKYGEREDSKSIMTDCSSSVSSGPDSEKCQFNLHSERKRRKSTGGSHCIDKNMNFLNFDPPNPYTIGSMEPSSVSKPVGSQMNKDHGIFCDLKRPSSSVNHFFEQNHNIDSFDAAMMMEPFKVCMPCDSWISKDLEISDEITRRFSSLDDKSYVQNLGLSPNRKKVKKWRSVSESENQHEELRGEVINLIDSPVLKDNISMAPINFSPSVPDDGGDSSRKSKIQRKLSYGQRSHPHCAADVVSNSSSDIWSSVKMDRPSSRGVSNHFPDPNFKTSNMPLRCNDDFSIEGLMQNSVRKSKVLSFSENVSHSDVTPLSNALRSDNLQESSPWTMEFLNKIKEKSRNRQQCLPSDSSSPFPEYLGNAKKSVKRRSPSILEFFRYQGGNTLKRKPEQKRQKQSIKSSNTSKNGVNTTNELSSWTPTDKRSRQTLSFAIDGTGSQTKLVWSDDTYCLHKSSQQVSNK